MERVKITIANLGIDELAKIISSNAEVFLDDETKEKINKCRSYLDQKIESGEEVFYGINTGFGSLCNTVISKDQLSQLQENLVKSHACGMGNEVPSEIVKIMLLLKIQGLSYGHSGVALETVQRLIDFYNHNIIPVVYQEGSLGASGDLAPLAHMSLPLLGLGEVYYEGQKKKASEVLATKNWSPLKLKSKEGLALLNGTQFMSAHGCWALIKAKKLSDLSDVIGALSLEAFDGRKEPFTSQVHEVRGHSGQIATAERLRELLAGSQLIDQPKVNVQDPYSFRCMPQVHGASKDVIANAEEVYTREINAVTDNPTIFPDDDMIVSAGNFHGQPLALQADFLSIALAELGSMSERRVYKLIGGTRELPSFLVAKSGINSGFMIAQYAIASVVSKNKTLCTPASVDTIDSSQGQEDHVSMGANAVVKLCEVVTNLEKILGVELLTACQALDFRGAEKTSPKLKKIYNDFRNEVSFIDEDIYMHEAMEKAISFVKSYKL
ncbi:histidine ammonia-lyase [Parvicella tangerina]|uniref:Histidine ammonia-lyase n=1 Tax=Parvicella tangerina TaxID=2829795 RepID=A0A916JRL4_9FLAO|nr:histidine ammonia-lyase [Parvicella tangerina]CAG5087837.1 Histidine ammonia-lyase [Parvicella tangerina]